MFKLIKILYIIDNVSKNSGVSSVIMNYCSGISKDNFSIDFLLMKKYTNSYEEELIENKSNVFYLSARPNIYTYNKLLKEFKAFLFENRYDIIELHAPTYSFIFMKILKKMNVPIRIIHTHSTVRSSSFFKNILSHVLNFNIKKYANVYFSCSNASGRYWFGNSIENNPNYYTITNGIDIKKPTILIREEEYKAHYVKEKIPTIYEVIPLLKEEMDANLVIMPRYEKERLKRDFGGIATILEEKLKPEEFYPFIDLFIGGGGTMNLEAVCYGIPTISTRSIWLVHDQYLIKNKLMFWSQDCKEIIEIAKAMLGKRVDSRSYFVQGECSFDVMIERIEREILC